MIAPGEPAPAFELPDQDGKPVSLEALRGRMVLLVFYPLDFSPVCSDQLSDYERELAPLADRGTAIYGISVDSAFCHKAFRRHLGIRIPLLADFEPKGEVARRYGVYIDGRGHSQRALVLIGPDGAVRWSHIAASPLEIPPASLVLEELERAA